MFFFSMVFLHSGNVEKDCMENFVSHPMLQLAAVFCGEKKTISTSNIKAHLKMYQLRDNFKHSHTTIIL